MLQTKKGRTLKMNDNNFNYEELENALKLIQNVCKDVVSCEFCPFGNSNGDCLITGDVPSEWRITSPESIIRLMK